MLSLLQEIERDFGRNRAKEVRRGARTLDLDILLCGDRVIETPGLVADPRTGKPYTEARAALERDSRSDGGVYLHPAGEYTGPSNTEA
jgi:hypothetical protein